MRQYADGKILVESHGPVTMVTINRPGARNALDNADDVQLVAVLTGAGAPICAGADLKEVAGSADYVSWAGDPEGPSHLATIHGILRC